MNSQSVQDRLATTLGALGDNAEDVASLLKSGGWRGLPHDATRCPVARYLRTVMTDVTSAAVGSDRATAHTADGEGASVVLPRAIAGFVLAFDVGAYPDLIATPTDDNSNVER
jgi:hypothetical protein